MSKLDPRLAEAIEKVKGKRPRTLIDHVLKHGFITTEELKEKYGYGHPPRVAGDVREAGIPLETFRVRGSDGRMIGAYRFGNPDKIEDHKLEGRRTFPKELKDSLLESEGSRCAICQTEYEGRYLQIDHRVPYGIAGDSEAMDEDLLMLLCGSCQRKKSWTCENCDNWSSEKSESHCEKCYWANPENHEHFAGKEIRRLDVSWVAEEVPEYGVLKKLAEDQELTISELAKKIIAEALKDNYSGN